MLDVRASVYIGHVEASRHLGGCGDIILIQCRLAPFLCLDFVHCCRLCLVAAMSSLDFLSTYYAQDSINLKPAFYVYHDAVTLSNSIIWETASRQPIGLIELQ